MDHINSVVCICETYEEAQRAMYNLEAAHIDMGTLSIATKDISSKLHQVDFYNFGDETFSIPDIGALLVSGRLSTWIAGAFHNSASRGVSQQCKTRRPHHRGLSSRNNWDCT
jgi:hypothetical protein